MRDADHRDDPMSRQEWGRTGRVTLEGCDCPGYHREQSRHVHVDGAYVGAVSSWGSMWRPWYGERSHDLPAYSETADAAVMYVLRRAAPAVWLAERGPVWTVRRDRDVEWSEWLAIHPAGHWCLMAATCADALGEADRLARQEGEGQ